MFGPFLRLFCDFQFFSGHSPSSCLQLAICCFSYKPRAVKSPQLDTLDLATGFAANLKAAKTLDEGMLFCASSIQNPGLTMMGPKWCNRASPGQNDDVPPHKRQREQLVWNVSAIIRGLGSDENSDEKKMCRIDSDRRKLLLLASE
jgi:hypothetical protein